MYSDDEAAAERVTRLRLKFGAPLSSLNGSIPVLLAVMLAACAHLPPSVLVLHSPIQPTNAQTVTYTANAYSGDGINQIQIWDDINTLGTCPNGMHCATHVSSHLLKTCPVAPATNNATCTFITPSAYADGSFIGYRAVASSTNGSTAADGWIYFAAGAYPWPNDPIPVYATGAPAEKVDLVFIPDPDYAGNNTQFVQDASEMLAKGYMGSGHFADYTRWYRGLWNYYITYRTGDAAGYPPPAASSCNTEPSNWTNLRAIVNNGVIIHTQTLRDCSGVGDGSIFSVDVGSFGTALHETGHAVFGLADEYCCDGGYFENTPHANVFTSEAHCRADATTNGWPPGDCAQIASGTTTTGYWRSDGTGDLMVSSTVANNFGRSDKKRILWWYFDQCLGTPGC